MSKNEISQEMLDFRMRMSEVKCVVCLLRCMFQDDGETFWCQRWQRQYIDNLMSVYQTVVISFNSICLNDADLPIVEEGDLARNVSFQRPLNSEIRLMQFVLRFIISLIFSQPFSITIYLIAWSVAKYIFSWLLTCILIATITSDNYLLYYSRVCI